MAILYYAVGQAGQNGQSSAVPVMDAAPRITGSMNTAASVTRLDGVLYVGEVVSLKPVGNAVWLRFDADAAVGSGVYVSDGERLELQINQENMQMTVIDA